MTETWGDQVWQRCKCDQWGRCLVDCPTEHLPLWDTALGRRLGYRRPDGEPWAQEDQ